MGGPNTKAQAWAYGGTTQRCRTAVSPWCVHGPALLVRHHEQVAIAKSGLPDPPKAHVEVFAVVRKLRGGVWKGVVVVPKVRVAWAALWWERVVRDLREPPEITDERVYGVTACSPLFRTTSSMRATFPIFYGSGMEENTREAGLPHINGNPVRQIESLLNESMG